MIDELLRVADSNGCDLGDGFKQRIMEEMTKPNMPESIMWQDFVARRPMEVETYLGSPIKLAKDARVAVPRIETLYAILHHLNIVNRNKPKPGDTNSMMPPTSPTGPSPMPRLPSSSSHRPMGSGIPNGMAGPPRQPRHRASSNFGQGPMRRPPPPMNGGMPNGHGRPQMNGGSRAPSRRGSMDGNDLEEFSHLVLYNDIPEGSEPPFAEPSDLALREREMQVRQREMALREQDMRVRRGAPGPHGVSGPRRGPHPMRNSQQVFDDDDDDDFYDPMAGPPTPMIDPDNFDMMSVTSRKNRKTHGATPAQLRRNPEIEAQGPPSRGGRFRPPFSRNRSSQVHSPMMHENFLDDPLNMSCSSNRYGNVDRGTMGGSRANSMTAARPEEYGFPPGGGPPMMNGAFPRRTSQSPGNPYSPSMSKNGGRPSPPNSFGPAMNGRPSPPDGMRQPVPRYPPGQGNAIAPQQVEQHIGVSSLHPPKPRNVRSLTGSASASAGSGELDSEPSAHSSQTSLQQGQQRGSVGVR